MRILSAIYVTSAGDKQELSLHEVTSKIYENKLKGNLYCPTAQCPARISYSGGRKAHFRTWRMDKHARGCSFYFDRNPVNTGIVSAETINLQIPHSQRQNALREAFKIMNLTPEELEAIRKKDSAQPRDRKRKITKTQERITSMQMVLFDGDEYGEQLIKPRTNIYKRLVDDIRESDIGKTRLIMGYVGELIDEKQATEIKVTHNKEEITVVFEEAFVRERLNSSYINNFWAIQRLKKEELDRVCFTGIGEVRNSKERLELVIYMGSDFKLNNWDMSALAAWFVRQDIK